MARWLLLLCLLLGLAGCQTYLQSTLDPQKYSQHYKFYDLEFFWKNDHTPDSYSIEGLVQNNRYANVRDLELSATLLQKDGKELATSTFYFFPNLLSIDEKAPFTLVLPIKQGQQPAKLKFFYRYRLAEHGYEQSPYFYSFIIDLY